MMLMRVIMLIQKYFPYVGGAERQLQQLSSRLVERGIDVIVITRRHDKRLSSFEVIDGIPVHRLFVPGPKPVAAFSYIFFASKLILQLRPDIIHAHEVLSPASAALIAKMLLGTPVIVKVLGGGTRGDIHKIQHRFLGKQRIAGLRRNVDIFIAISKQISDELAEITIPAQKCTTIPNGVDTNSFLPVTVEQKRKARTHLGLPQDIPIISYVGRLHSDKRIDLLLSVWPAIYQQFPRAQLLIVGAGPAEVDLRQQQSEGVHFCGQTDYVIPYLRATDLFVLPSAREGMSNALLEAMSMGLPVLATDVGGTPDVVVHGKHGYLIRPNDAGALQEGLTRLLNDSVLRRSLGQAARKHIVEEYSFESVADRYKELYEGLRNAVS